MFPLMGDDDRENMTRIWQMVMPPEAFAGAIQLVQQAIGDDWAELTPAHPRTGRVTPTSPKREEGRLEPSLRAVPEPLVRVGDDFEDEYPGASALATECFANLCQAGGPADGAAQPPHRASSTSSRPAPARSSPSSKAPASHSSRA